MEQEDIILDACLAMERDHFYVRDSIPHKKRKRAIKEMNIPDNEQIIALVDCTVFGSAKHGSVFTNKGIHVKNGWTSDVREAYLDWESVMNADLMYSNKFGQQEIWINNLHVEMSGSSLLPEYLHEVIVHIQEKLHEFHQGTNLLDLHQTPSESLETHTQSWMVAVNKEKYGPYEINTIGQMLMNGQLKAERDYVWKQGMDEWIPINESGTFQQYIAPPLTQSTPGQSEKRHVTMDKLYDTMNINDAELSQLLTLPYLTLPKANALLLKREELGQFESLEEIQEVIQLQPHQFEELKQLIIIDLEQTEIKWGRTVDY